jgi:hypothetical protein
MGRVAWLLVVVGGLLSACGGDETSPVAASPVAASPAERYEKALATQEAIGEILDDPESYGSEDEVVELLASHATDGAVMDDEVFGAAPMIGAWHYTLYGDAMDARIDIYHRWLSEDGSQGGALWMWHGTNQAGNRFELPGISLDTYDEDGLITYEYVTYPYPDDYVEEAIEGKGT